jgi:hypothetical protein
MTEYSKQVKNEYGVFTAIINRLLLLSEVSAF